MPSALYRPLEQSLQDCNEDDADLDYEALSYAYKFSTSSTDTIASDLIATAKPTIEKAATTTKSATFATKSHFYKPTSLTMAAGRLCRHNTNMFALICCLFFLFALCVMMSIRDDGSDDGTLDEQGISSFSVSVINESRVVCGEDFTDSRAYIQNKPIGAYADLPIIYFVTPTYPRREQIPELTRLAHTLLHVARLHWIVADDHDTCNVFLNYLLNKFGIPYTHLASPMPSKFRGKDPAPRGVANRRAAIQWLRQCNITKGVLYFGDDDNTYDLKLFSEIRDTQRVSMFPVGLIAENSISGPVVRTGKVVGFLDSWVADRHWPVDMAGFAVNLAYMALHPNASMPYKPGYEEDYFLRSIRLKMSDIEPKGTNCTEILVWHTQTKSKKISVVRISSEYLDDRSNLGALFKTLEIMGVAKASETVGRNAIISKNGRTHPHAFFLS